jgi:hypothetical protein
MALVTLPSLSQRGEADGLAWCQPRAASEVV